MAASAAVALLLTPVAPSAQNAPVAFPPQVKFEGYQVWADALKPILTELLGPPAKEDHAPPPTGDPGAVKRPLLQ